MERPLELQRSERLGYGILQPGINVDDQCSMRGPCYPIVWNEWDNAIPNSCSNGSGTGSDKEGANANAMITTNRPTTPLAFGVLLLIGAASCQQGPSETELAAIAEAKNLKVELQSRDSLIGDMTRSFGEIETNLAMIDAREKVIGQAPKNELSMDQRKRILDDIQLMNSLMMESRDQIAELTGKLDRSRVETGSLRKKLKALDTEIASRDSALTQMKADLLAKDFKIEEVNKRLSEFELEIARRQATIEQLGDELASAYYTIGTRKELEERGVLLHKGGVLGLGTTAILNTNVQNERFNQVDTRSTERIPLKGEKLTLVTEHPESSYEVVKEEDHLAYLRIKDPETFWRLSHYLVAEVK